MLAPRRGPHEPIPGILQRLLAYAPKKLACNEPYDDIGRCHCAVGALAAAQGFGLPNGSFVRIKAATRDAPRTVIYRAEPILEALGGDAVDCDLLEAINDEDGGRLTPEERWVVVCSLVSKIAELDDAAYEELRQVYRQGARSQPEDGEVKDHWDAADGWGAVRKKYGYA